jgi:hypothetical protein
MILSLPRRIIEGIFRRYPSLPRIAVLASLEPE